jgi:regulator of protease activity HflC (stomatin/prohibitin superfamily)
MTAERKKRAAVLTAQGEQEAAVLKAEGAAQARVREAEGVAAARIKIAQAEAEALERLQQTLGVDRAAAYLVAMKYLESLEKVADGQASKVFLPLEANGVLGALESLRELWNEDVPGPSA